MREEMEQVVNFFANEVKPGKETGNLRLRFLAGKISYIEWKPDPVGVIDDRFKRALAD
jgi:hypothetical protein